MENNREPGVDRTAPKIYSPRYYYFKQLKFAIDNVISKHVESKNYEKLVDYGCGNVPYKPFFAKHVKEYMP